MIGQISSVSFLVYTLLCVRSCSTDRGRVKHRSDLSRLWAKVREILEQRRRHFVPSNAFDRLSMSRFVRQIFTVKSQSRRKPNKCKSFLAPNFFSRGTTPTCLRQIVNATYRPPFDKVWLSSVCWSPSAKPGNEIECRIYREWVKCTSNLKLFVNQSWCRFEAT